MTLIPVLKRPLSDKVFKMSSRRVMSKTITVLFKITLRLAFVRIKPGTDYIQACSTNGIETSTSIPPHCLLHSLWFVLECVSKCWLCVSRFCPARLLPIDSRWDLSIKHPEPCSPPNPRVIQSPAPYTHTCARAYTPTSPVIHQYLHQGLYWSPSIQPLHPVQYNIRAKTPSMQV